MAFTNPEFSLNKMQKKHNFVMSCSSTSVFCILFYGILCFIMKTRCYKQTNIVVCMSPLYHSVLYYDTFCSKITDFRHFLKASGKALFTFIDHIFMCFYIPSSLNIPI